MHSQSKPFVNLIAGALLVARIKNPPTQGSPTKATLPIPAKLKVVSAAYLHTNTFPGLVPVGFSPSFTVL
jgi:hypothetical protein